ncbi:MULTISPECIES: iron-hydroxamate ABC transporter substrate-binding protein [Brevibacillus]|uniref:Iron-uptake system-binding protein n=1 Tax=Brevibacillus porteri TaxID=2126350 RepID=A0ABX5FRB5_9BACL|nr:MULTISPECIES: iron-hydroxamate ABC transporter substrate-binding protein [Brevibacillus]MDC0764689.1 iron-hydroxamate ABC transporter substrate-binding protein [Brevibacillus sp. AG]MED1797131.1 iron-hydroxamate ABC transporter substrate-binding protein [Brevibacillus porteri]MED2133379.1 iron-hydroxamate ABC transporter substrate-binding protein [Brevibacillus porteri]MED2746362.1 iron-hydroxamate ABC transporter substrate-binding protein [Brevibacillus porteri]MED2815129.1 iron-hydroxamat
MKKIYLGLSIAALTLALTACGGGKEAANNTTAPTAAPATTATAEKPADDANKAETRTIKYLDKEYTVPSKTERIAIVGSMESMEDSLVLNVNPVGAISVGGKFPEMFAPITGEATSIGEKIQPNLETILSLKPDVILGSSKFPPEMAEKLNKIAPTFPVSHISTNWEANLQLLGELTGKQAEAEKALNEYKSGIEAAKAKLGDSVKDKKVLVIRLRQGNINIYPEKVFFNPALYADLGLTAPEEVKAAKAQEIISMEKFSQINPDYLFIQFSPDENKDKPNVLEDLQNNPIWKSVNAVKNGKVYVNVVDPLAQGGTAWSKTQFLKAAVEKLSAK